jgi:hypothetical protein
MKRFRFDRKTWNFGTIPPLLSGSPYRNISGDSGYQR